ncbi:hypothetical protein [Chondromyces apiculatus]|uniref:Uncharacterized protein n=1 Tax=Chondromyces apiculatus DSM 436 TaxID=1192034 RepID=A0A017T1H6_9BACT|nr:hypothetical protein [Chondromyces apiculatus]EYF03094.1 Hypothetical protein CAP_6208 [Chondromyces apiculatus DSM 436]
MNNAALIEVYRGDLRSAHRLCQMQLRWAARSEARYGGTTAGVLAVQPWINLGRLKRLEKDVEGALAHFSLVVATLDGAPVRLGPLHLDAEAWQEVVRHRSLLGMLKAVYLIDSVKTFLGARDEGAALGFLRQARERLGGPPSVLLNELELLVLSRAGRLDEAASVLERESWGESDYAKLLRVTYRIALRAASGEVDRARRTMEQLVARVQAQEDFGTPADICIPRYLEYLGTLAGRLELPAAEMPVWRLARQAAKHLDDMPCRLVCLDALLALEGVAEREELLQEREALLQECLYVALMRGRGLGVDRAALADPVFDELHRKLEAIGDAEGKSGPPPEVAVPVAIGAA